MPSGVCQSLESYKNQFIEKGVQPNIELLNNQIELFQLELEGKDADQWKDLAINRAFDKLFSNHSLVQSHFPLDMERQKSYRDSPVNLQKFSDDQFRDNMDRLINLTDQFN